MPAPDRIAALFSELLELGEAARSERLERERTTDAELATELESLLAAQRNARHFLEPIEAERALELLGEEHAEAEDVGLRVGHYRLGPLLGRGGMGVVHLAERAEGDFEQRVAIKLLRPDASRDGIRERFLAERRILARLEHPNIARLLDGGVAEDGRPFFAMEYVEGETLTDWCDARELDIEQRLELFLRVCEPVRYAHSNLVVHRDLKPSNILVDAAGEPKLLDFGIAKLLEPESDGALQTVAGGHRAAMTPEYAAPEQLLGEPATTLTDVYALGVILYELLTGRHPYRIRRSLFGLVSEPPSGVPPERPSTAVRRPPDDNQPETPELDEPEAASRRRGSERKRLAHRLAGDLDAITLRALQFEPGRRYGSVDALAADLRRHLEGHPVEARATPLSARARLFVRRHLFGVTAAATVGLALAAGLAIAAVEARRAEREARQARAALGFLTEMLESADPSRSLGERITAVQLLDAGALRLASDPGLAPTVRAEIADTLARTYRGLGQLDEAEAAARQALDLFRREVGTADQRTLLAEVTAAEILSDRGEVAAAKRRLEQILPRIEDAFGPGAEETTRTRIAYATVLGAAGEFDAALTEERRALERVRRSRGDQHPETAVRLGSLASALSALSRYEEAESALRDALGILEQAGALDSPRAALLKTHLADLLDTLERPEEAERYFRDGLEIARATLSPNHPQVAQTLIKRGVFLVGQNRPVEARADLEGALAILEPIGHFDAGAALRYLGFLELREERFDRARDIFSRAEAMLAGKLGGDHPLTWAAAVTAAYADARAGGVDSGAKRLRAAVTALERLHGTDSNDVRVPRKYLGQILTLAGRPEEAVPIHRAALEMERERFGGDESSAVTASKELLAEDLLALSGVTALAEARGLVDEALVYARAHEPETARTGRLLALSGRIAIAQRDSARARTDLADAVALLETALPPEASSTREARAALATIPPAPRR